MTVQSTRSWAMFCMALWLMGTVSMAIVATQNFYTIDRLLDAQSNPAFTAAIDKFGRAEARDLLRYFGLTQSDFYHPKVSRRFHPPHFILGPLRLVEINSSPLERSGPC